MHCRIFARLQRRGQCHGVRFNYLPRPPYIRPKTSPPYRPPFPPQKICSVSPYSTILGVYRCQVNSSGACTSPGYKAGVWGQNVYSASGGWETPTWMLAVGGIMIGIGFTSYGYNLLRSLGNNLTYHSPSRCYCMEFGAAIVVLLASRIGLPISTTQCITGATMAVGLLNGATGVNWKRFASIFFSWCITMPFVGIYAGLLYLFMASNPTNKAPSIV